MLLLNFLYAGVIRTDVTSDTGETASQESIRRGAGFSSVCFISTTVNYRDGGVACSDGTGVLIKPDEILTAAHVVPSSAQIMCGDIESIDYYVTNDSQTLRHNPALWRNGLSVTYHPSLNAKYRKDLQPIPLSRTSLWEGIDLAKIKLDRPFHNVPILPIAGPGDHLIEGTSTFVTSFGAIYLQDGTPQHVKNDHLRHLFIRTIYEPKEDKFSTRPVLEPFEGESVNVFKLLPETAAHRLSGKGLPGDSGSPCIAQYTGGKKKIIGIYSSTAHCNPRGSIPEGPVDRHELAQNYGGISFFPAQDYFVRLNAPTVREWIVS